MQTFGGVISLTKQESSFQSLLAAVKSSSYEWKSLDQEEKHFIIHGPIGLSVVCSCYVNMNEKVEPNNITISFLENLCQSLDVPLEDIPEEPDEHPPSFTNAPSAPPLIPNLTIQVCFPLHSQLDFIVITLSDLWVKWIFDSHPELSSSNSLRNHFLYRLCNLSCSNETS
jgi:hypothetical protein